MILIAGAFGFLAGLAAHDIAIQALDNDARLRPWTGTCPDCGHRRGWHRRTCPSCGRSIQREPVIAVTTALMFMAVFELIGADWLLVPYLGFVFLTMALVVTDLEDFRIVDRINLPGTAVLAVLLALIAALSGNWGALLRGLGGAAAYFAGALVVFVIARGQGFGAGDVKLAPQLGLFTAYISWGVLGWAVFATALIGGAVAVTLLVLGRAKRDTELPYGPPMVLGAWLALTMAALGSIPIPS